MGKLVFYAHAGSTNHGCEAIVRSTVGMLKEKAILYSMNRGSDIKYGISDLVTEIKKDENQKINKKSLKGFVGALSCKLTGRIDKIIYYRKQEMFDSVEKGDIWFSIGGDNYCYPGTDILAAENRLIKKKGAKTVLWGCSVSPELLEQKAIADDIATFDLITARETISYDALKKVNSNTVLVSDPAFTLPIEKVSLPTSWLDEKMIGINASPLILKAGDDSEKVLVAYKALIQYIIENENYNIVLIPHVVTKHDDDRMVLQKLYQEFKDSNRVILLDDYNCSQIKYVISKCEMFIGARTHATIAAYSTGVPTLVIGYSVKSKGIAKDLFGTYENYVLPVQDIRDVDDIIKYYQWLKENKNQIKEHLTTFMPNYIQQAYTAIEALETFELHKGIEY